MELIESNNSWIITLIGSNSSWIIALGKTVLNSLWIGLLTLSLLKVLFLLIPQRFSAIRYHASLFSLLIFTVLIAALFLHIHNPTEAVKGILSDRILLQEAAYRTVTDGSNGGSLLFPSITLVYLAGMGIYLSVTLISLGKIRSLRLGAENITGRWYQLFCELKQEASISRKVEFLVSEQASGPFLTGVLKPAIIVPSAMLSQLSFREIEAILLHELYHLKQLDHVINLIQNLVEILFFFNPAVWMLSRIIRIEREKRCDDLVISGNTIALDYVRALYALSMQMKRSGLCATAATGNGKGELRKRIERILKPNTMKTNYREKINALLLFTCGILVVLLISGFTSGFSISLHNDEPLEIALDSEDPKSPESHEPISLPELPVPPAPLENPATLLLPPSTPDTLTEQEMEMIRVEVKEAIEEVPAIDWEQIKMEMEEARLEVMEEIDWEQIKMEMEEARLEVMEEIDWEQMKMEMEDARNAVMEDIDWEQIKEDMANLRINIDSMLTDFDFDMDMDFDMDIDIDMDVVLDVDSIR